MILILIDGIETWTYRFGGLGNRKQELNGGGE